MTHALPGDSLHQLLAELPQRVPVHLIDRVWIFPSRHAEHRESGLAVLALLDAEGQATTRRVVTLRYEVRGSGSGATRSDLLVEQGTAPAASVQGIIDGVLRRLGDDAREPVLHEIQGDPARWSALLASFAQAEVDRGSGE